jgi:4'-phosphopantetheinyl transferase
VSARLWWVDPVRFHETTASLALLTVDERAQHQRFIPPGKRHEFLVARVLTRTVLSRELGCAPMDVHFTKNQWGRPDVAGLHFNLTHTDGLVAMLVSREHEVGCDTELLSRAPKLLALGSNVFAPKELGDLAALPEDERAQRAVTLWTLKESYIKARGMGLALALDGFAFRFSPSGVHLEVEPALNDDGARWQFKTITLGPHLISTAISCAADQPVEVELVEAALPELSR